MAYSLPVAVVTGGNRGIGLEACRQLAELGYAVVLGARDAAKRRNAAARIAAPGAVTFATSPVKEPYTISTRSPGSSRSSGSRGAPEEISR